MDSQPDTLDDVSALAWVQDELRKSLDAAHKALRRTLRDTESTFGSDLDDVEPALLRNARHQLHQGVGVLELVGLPAAATLLRASESLVQRYIAKPHKLDPAAVDAIEHASFALLDFLARRLGGKPVSPLALFPQYRAVQELAGAERVHPADLWPQDWQWLVLPAPADALPRPVDAATVSEFETEVLTLMRKPSAEVTGRLATLSAELAAGAAQLSGGEHASTLWQLAAAFFEAQSAGLLEADVYTKRLTSRLLGQLRSQLRGDTAAPERLAQDLAFFCAQAAGPDEQGAAPRLAAVRGALRLARDAQAGNYRHSDLGRYDPSWVAQARKRVANAKDAWSAVAGGEMHRLNGLIDQFGLVADSLRRLVPGGERLGEALSQAVTQTVHGGVAPPPALAMEIATSVLYLEAGLEDNAFDQPEQASRVERLAERIGAVQGGAAPEPLEPWMEELYRRVSDRQTMGSVVQELRSALSESEKAIDQFFRAPEHPAALIPVPAQLQAMRGVMSVLGLEQASQAVLRMRDDVDALVGAGEQARHEQPLFERLAGNLGALSFLIDLLGVQPQAAKSLFRFDAASGLLLSQLVRRATPLEAAAAPRLEPALIAQAQELAAGATATLPLIDLSLGLERLSLEPEVSAQPGLAAPLAGAQALLGQAEAAGAAAPSEAALREQVAGALAEFLSTATDPVGLEPAATAPLPLMSRAPAAPVEATGLEGDDEMLEIFLEEAREVLQTARDALAELRQAPDDLEQLTTVRRAFHTLKGSSRMVGLKDFGEAGWAGEQLYNAWLASQRPASEELLGLTGELLAYLSGWVVAIGTGQTAGWHSAPVRHAADALRLEGRRVAVADGGAAAEAPAGGTSRVAAVEAATSPAPVARPQTIELRDFAAASAPVDLVLPLAEAETAAATSRQAGAETGDEMGGDASARSAPETGAETSAPSARETGAGTDAHASAESGAEAGAPAESTATAQTGASAGAAESPEPEATPIVSALEATGAAEALGAPPVPPVAGIAAPAEGAEPVDLAAVLPFGFTLPSVSELELPADGLEVSAADALERLAAGDAPTPALGAPGAMPAGGPAQPLESETGRPPVSEFERPPESEAELLPESEAELPPESEAEPAFGELVPWPAGAAPDGLLSDVPAGAEAMPGLDFSFDLGEPAPDATDAVHAGTVAEPPAEAPSAGEEITASGFGAAPTLPLPLPLDAVPDEEPVITTLDVELPANLVAALEARGVIEPLAPSSAAGAGSPDAGAGAEPRAADSQDAERQARPEAANPEAARPGAADSAAADSGAADARTGEATSHASEAGRVAAAHPGDADRATAAPLASASADAAPDTVPFDETTARDATPDAGAASRDGSASSESGPVPHPFEAPLVAVPLERLPEAANDAAPAAPVSPASAEEPAAVQAGSIASAEPSAFAPASDEPDSDQLKRVGPLRISIPLFNVFLNEADELSRRLGIELSEWALELHRPVGESAVTLAHSLAGGSATVGFTDLSALARQLEHALMRSRSLGSGTPEDARLFETAADELRRLLHQFAAGFLKAPAPGLMEQLAAHERALVRRLEAQGTTRSPRDAELAAAQAAEEAEAAHAAEPFAGAAPGAPAGDAVAGEPVEAGPAASASAAGDAPAADATAADPATDAGATGPAVDTAAAEAAAAKATAVGAAAAEAAASEAAAAKAEAAAAHPAPGAAGRAAAWPPAEAADSRLGGASGFAELGQAEFKPFVPLAEEPVQPAPALALDGDDDIDQVDAVDLDLFGFFEEEAQELLPTLAAQLRDWVAEPAGTAAASAAMRTLHTLKGGARLAGAMRLGEQAHRLETAIEHLLALDAPSAAGVEALLARADSLNASFEALRQRDAQAYEAARVAAEASAASAAPALRLVPLPPLQPAIEVGVASGAAGDARGAAMPGRTSPAHADFARPSGTEPMGRDAERAGLDPADTDKVPADARHADAAEAAASQAGAASAEARAAEEAPAAPATDAIDWSRFVAADAADVPTAAPAERAPLAVQSSVRVRAPLLDRMVNQAGEVSIRRARLESELAQMRGSLADLGDNLERLRQQLRDIELQAETQMGTRMEAAKAAAENFDPLEFDRYTRFQELTRMMAESVNDVATVQRSLQRTLETAEDELVAQARLARELQDDLLRTRMVEFEGLSERLYRVVRQAAKETGKQVRLDIVGGSIELDRGVLDRMIGGFEHLLRNCVTHGIEPPAARSAAGKDPTGHIVVALHQEGNEVSVEFRDDGAGLDLPRIRAKAVAAGLLDPQAEASDAELANLIFTPGFSTAETVTELAGRGIGMDVVRSEVNALGGRIETASARGQGSSFKLVLPLTTAVTQVVMLRCGATTVAVPSTLVEIVRRATADEVEAAYRSGAFVHGGQALPFFWLGALLQASARSAEPAGRMLPVVVIRSAQQRVVLHVDEVLGNHEVVVKNLGPQLSRLPGLAGMTLLASGAVALIYNPVALATVYAEAARHATAAALHAGPEAGEPAAARAGDVPQSPAAALVPAAPLVLVVDDSLTVRRVTQRLLVREGYRVALAKDGLEALERLAEERPSVVLSDIEMPRMDGFDLVRNLRGDAALASLPVIMITSRIAQKHREYAHELGVDHYLGKPYGEDELLTLIGRYCAAAQASA